MFNVRRKSWNVNPLWFSDIRQATQKKAKLEFPCSSQKVRRIILLIGELRNNSMKPIICINNYLFIYFFIQESWKFGGPSPRVEGPKDFAIPTSLKFTDEAHVWTTQKHLFDAWVDLVAHSFLKLSAGEKKWQM